MIIDTALTVNPKKKKGKHTHKYLTLMSNKGNLRVMFTKKTLCAALKFAQMENLQITQSKHWNYFKNNNTSMQCLWGEHGL